VEKKEQGEERGREKEKDEREKNPRFTQRYCLMNVSRKEGATGGGSWVSRSRSGKGKWVMKSWSHYIDVEQTNFRMRHIYVEKVK
jgi:hypothetical protein